MLREMYFLVKRKDDLASVESVDGHAQELETFMDEHDLTKLAGEANSVTKERAQLEKTKKKMEFALGKFRTELAESYEVAG